MKDIKKKFGTLMGKGDDYDLITRLPAWLTMGLLIAMTSCTRAAEDGRDYWTTFWIAIVVMAVIIGGMMAFARKNTKPQQEDRPRSGPGETKNTAGPGANKPQEDKNR